MFTFISPADSKNIWKLCFRPEAEMNRIYYGDKPVECGIRIHGMTEYITQTVYIDTELDGYPLDKVLRHELTHVYLWETGQQGRAKYTEEDIADIISVSSKKINDCTDTILLRLKEANYKGVQKS